MKISIIAIGDELLIGQVVDTNSGDIARTIAQAGWEVADVQTVHDDAHAIADAIGRAMSVCDVVLTTGGLGPTKDDITKSTLLGIFGGELREDKSVLENIGRVFASRNLTLNELTRSQAMVPTTCKVIQNPVGTAPVMWFEQQGKVLAAMPGVPFEMREVFGSAVFPMLLERFGSDMFISRRTFIVSGITESDLAERLADFETALHPSLHLAYLPNSGYIRLRLDGKTDNAEALRTAMQPAIETLTQLLGEQLLAEGDLTPEQILFSLLKSRRHTLATAESCTGGNIAHRLTMLAGISEVFAGGVVSYSNEMKINALGVDRSTIEKFGAVSEPVAAMMAEGIRRVAGTDFAIATSGIAGPGGGSAEKPVGTVCMAFATPNGTTAATYHFPGDRARIIDRASTTALIEMAARAKRF